MRNEFKRWCKIRMNLKSKYSESELAEINEILKGCKKLHVIDPWTKKSFVLDEEVREMLIKKYNFEITEQSNKKDSELSVKINVDTTELDEAIKKTNILKQLLDNTNKEYAKIKAM